MAEDDQYLDNLEAWVCEENKIITYRWLSAQLAVPANVAKQMLYAFTQRKGKEVKVLYYVSGEHKDRGLLATVVSASRLEALKKEMGSIHSLHVYSVQTALPLDSAQLCLADQIIPVNVYRDPEQLTKRGQLGAIQCKTATIRAPIPVAPVAVEKKGKEVKGKVAKVEPNDDSESTSQESPEKENKPLPMNLRVKPKAQQIFNPSGLPSASALGKKTKVSTTASPAKPAGMMNYFKPVTEEQKALGLATAVAKTTSPTKKQRQSMDFFVKKGAAGDVAKMDVEKKQPVKVKEERTEDQEDEEEEEEDLDLLRMRKKQEDAQKKTKAAEAPKTEKAKNNKKESAEQLLEEPPQKTKRRLRKGTGEVARAAAPTEEEAAEKSEAVAADETPSAKQRKRKRVVADEEEGEGEKAEEKAEVVRGKGAKKPVEKKKSEQKKVQVKQEKQDEDENELAAGAKAKAKASAQPTKRRRTAVKKEQPDEEEEAADPAEEEVAKPKSKRKEAAARTAKKQSSEGEPQKRARGRPRKKSIEKEPEQEGDNDTSAGGAEGEEEEAASKPKRVRKKKEVATSPVNKLSFAKAVPDAPLAASLAPVAVAPAGSTKRKKKVTRKFKNEKGFTVVEEAWVDASSDDEPAPPAAKVKSEPGENGHADGSSPEKQAATKARTQVNIMNFFTKK